jgi:hypothetical protein
MTGCLSMSLPCRILYVSHVTKASRSMSLSSWLMFSVSQNFAAVPRISAPQLCISAEVFQHIRSLKRGSGRSTNVDRVPRRVRGVWEKKALFLLRKSLGVSYRDWVRSIRCSSRVR